MNAAPETWMVTGSNRGIGLALVTAHLERGGKVLAHHRGSLEGDLAELKARFPDTCQSIAFDLRTSDMEVNLRHGLDGPVDAVIHNAAVFGPKGRILKPENRSGALEAFNVNVLSVVYLTQALLPYLAQSPRPRVAALTSLAGVPARAHKASLAYGMSKAGLNQALRMMAPDLAKQNIAVAALRPGHVPTGMNGFTGPNAPAESAAGILKVVDGMVVQVPPPFFDFTGEPLEW